VKIDSFQDMTKGRNFTPVRFGRPLSKKHLIKMVLIIY